MSAETLRRAAALMRERAEASLSPSPWCAEENSVWDADEHLVIASNVDILDDDIPHIASWHPAVALAVAMLLDNEANAMDRADEIDPQWAYNEARRSLLTDIARAYLGESA